MNTKNLLLAGLLLFTANLAAQTNIFRGFVLDKETEAPLPFANVLIVETKQATQTNTDGFFQINNVNPGNYTVEVQFIGYGKQTFKVEIKPGINNQKLFIEEKSEVLDDVVINAEKQRAQTNVLTSVVTLSPKKIVQFSVGGDADLIRAIQVLPGVITTGDQGGQLFIRGGAPIQNLVTLDGMIIYNPFHSIGFFSVFDTDILQSADIYTAGFNAEYGSRTSSVMDIRTRSGNNRRMSGKLTSSAFMSRALLEGPIFKKKNDDSSPLSFLVSAKHSYLDYTGSLFYPYAETAFGPGELPFTFTDIFAKVTLKSTTGTQANLFGFNFNDGVRLAPGREVNWNNRGGGFDFKAIPPASATIIGGDFSINRYEIFSTEIDGQPRSSSIGGFNGGLNFTYFLRDNDELKYGIQIIGYSTELRLVNPVGAIVQQQHNTTELAGYLRYKIEAGRWLIEPGMRLHYYSSLNELSFEPRYGVKYNLNENVRLKSAGGFYSQNLIAANSDRDVVNLFYGFLSNATNTPAEFRGATVTDRRQKAWHVVAGFEYDFNEYLTFNVEGYIKDFNQLTNLNRDKIYPDNQNYADEHDYLKKDLIIERGLARGVDILTKYERNNFYLWLAYSLSKVTRTDELRTYYPVYDRRHNMNVVGTYIFGKNREYEVGVRWNFGTGFPFTPTQGYGAQQTFVDPFGRPDLNYDYLTNNGTPLIHYGELNSKRLPTYHRLDFSAKRTWKINKYSNFDLTVAVTNAYNRLNIFFFDRNTAQRVNQLPILPTLIAAYTF